MIKYNVPFGDFFCRALETVKALHASLSQINSHIQQDCIDSLRKNATLSPAQNSAVNAVVGWNATYRNLCCLYRATELALVSLYDDQPRIAEEMLRDSALATVMPVDDSVLTWVVDQNTLDNATEAGDGDIDKEGRQATVKGDVYRAVQEVNRVCFP